MWRYRALWLGWGVALLLALALFGLFVQGLARDTRAGEPVIAVDFSSTDRLWAEARFRIRGEATYDLFISAVNHDPALVGRALGAEFEVQIADPAGKRVFDRRFQPASTGLQIPMNYGDVRLDAIQLVGSSWRPWMLRLRVLSPDVSFKPVQSQLKLYKRRYDPGMGGLINYVMILPAGLLIMVALAFAAALARSGRRLPLLVTGLAAALMVIIAGY